MNELQDNSITLVGDITSTNEKSTKDGQIVELKLSVKAKQLDGKRDKLASALAGMVAVQIIPQQTELKTDDAAPKEAEGQQELIGADGNAQE